MTTPTEFPTHQYKVYAHTTHEQIRAGFRAWDAIDSYLPLATPRELKQAIALALLGGLNMTQEICRMCGDIEM